jgi:hypothetical protein
MTVEEFIHAYRMLCVKAGFELEAVEQRKVVDGVWIISAPGLQVIALAEERARALSETLEVLNAAAN